MSQKFKTRIDAQADINVNSKVILDSDINTPSESNAMFLKTKGDTSTVGFKYDGKELDLDQIAEMLPTGILYGGILSKANNTQFTISAGEGLINILNKDTAAPTPDIKRITWSTQTITVFNLDGGNSDQINAFIYVDEDGIVQQQATAFSDSAYRSDIVIGAAIHTAGVINFTRNFPQTAYNFTHQTAQFMRIFGPMKQEGHVVSANGANLSVDRSAGIAFSIGRNYTTDPENPSLISDPSKTQCSIFRYYSDGSGGHVKDTNGGAGYTTLDVGNYDDGDGTLASVQNHKWSIQRLFFFPHTPDLLVAYYGKGHYNNLDEAMSALNTENFIEADNTATQAIYAGAVFVRGGGSNLSSDGDAFFQNSGIFRSIGSTASSGSGGAQNLSELDDAEITNPQEGQFVVFNSASSSFENQDVTTDDIDEGAINLYYTDTRVSANADVSANTTKLSGIEAGATADQTDAEIKTAYENNADTNAFTDSEKTKVGNISVTQPVNLDTIESDTATNNAKVSFPGFGTSSGTSLEGDTQFVDGTGTAGSLPKFSDSDTLTDSKISESGEVVAVNSTGAIVVPDGTTAERPSTPLEGMFRYNSEEGQFEGYTTEWGAIAGSGGGGGTLLVQKNEFSGDGTETTFTLSSNITSESQTQVYIDGVYQSKDNYSTSGSNIVFSEAPDNGTDIEVIHFVSVSATVTTDTFLGNGSTTQYTLSKSVSSENDTQVYFDGVYQSKSNYEVDGDEITFSTSPDSGVEVEVVVFKTVDVSSLNSNQFTGTGSQTDFTLSQEVDSKDKSFVFLQGVYQEKSTYVISGTTITFSTPPQNGYSIEVVTFSSVTVANEGISKGTTLQRPENPDDGFTRYNTDTKKLELYNGAGWFDIGPFYPLTADISVLTADNNNIKVSETTY